MENNTYMQPASKQNSQMLFSTICFVASQGGLLFFDTAFISGTFECKLSLFSCI